jgi:hypothetical protein
MLPKWMIERERDPELLLPDLPPLHEDGADPAEVEMNKAINEFSKSALEDNTKNLFRSVNFIENSFSWLRRAYGWMLALGLLALVAAIYKGLVADNGAELGSAAVIGGVSLGALISSLVLKPTESMERNAIFVPWMLLVLNTYWTRLVYMNDPTTVDKQLEDAAKDAADQFKLIAEAHAKALTTENERLAGMAAPSEDGQGNGSDEGRDGEPAADGDGTATRDGGAQPVTP